MFVDRLLPPISSNNVQLAHALGSKQAEVAHCAFYKGASFSKGDVLFIGSCATVVTACIELDDALSLLVNPCTFLCSDHPSSAKWLISAGIALVDLSMLDVVRLAACWSKETDNQLLVLDPWRNETVP